MKRTIISSIVLAVVLSVASTPYYVRAESNMEAAVKEVKLLQTDISDIQKNTDSVEAFVERFYKYILNREADESGLKAWSNNLKSGKEMGAQVGVGFVQSQEFKNRGLSNADYIKVLYRAFFDREADGAGLLSWLSAIDSGLTRMQVYRGFAESDEFSKLCASYGIQRGFVTMTASMDKNEGVTKFVARCYKLCLGRNADEGGLDAWCNQILSGANSAKDAAYGFVFSNEFISRKLSDEEYVRVLYRVFMDREADGSGLNAWVKVLNQGKSREHVFNGFADSAEFQRLCDSYGIYAGEPSPPEIESWKKDYVKIIKDYRLAHEMSGAKFSLYDMDENQIPELILTYGYGSEIVVYTYIPGNNQAVVIYSKTATMMGIEIRLGSNGYFLISDPGMDSVTYTLYEYNNDNVVGVWETIDMDGFISETLYSYRYPSYFFLDGFNGSTPVGEITVDNIENYVR